jgi:hypothetical protein
MIYFIVIATFIISLVAIAKVPKWDPRWESARIFAKGQIVFLAGVILIFIAGKIDIYALKTTIKSIGYITCIPGFTIMFWGLVKHAQKIFSPIDPKRETDPGYDLEYIQCPHCQKARMRKEKKVVKCPICKKRTKIEDF